MRTFLIIGMIHYFMIGSGSLDQRPEWPAFQPLHEARTFVGLASGSDAPVLLFIKNAAGVSIYRLVCHSGNYDGDTEYNFSGTFQCALFAVRGDKATSGNLLAANTKDEQSTDWWNRGRMKAAELRGECLAYPEYSTVRHFKLRGMLITFRFDNVEWSTTSNQQHDSVISKFTFSLDVVPDNSAHSSVAELAQGPKPPASCYP
jgi:hypothetical protein